jgi:hypothetical protein
VLNRLPDADVGVGADVGADEAAGVDAGPGVATTPGEAGLARREIGNLPTSQTEDLIPMASTGFAFAKSRRCTNTSPTFR